MKLFTKTMAVAIAIAAFSVSGAVKADIVYAGSTINENFDSLGITTIASVFSATVGTQAAVPGTSGFDGTKLAGTGTTATGLTASDGSATSGGIYSFGATGDLDRALGAIASGTNIMGFGFRLVNGTTDTVDSITVAFTQENWRSSTATTNTLASSFSFDQALVPAGFLTNIPSFTAQTSLDLVGPPFVAANGLLNGNDPLNQAVRTFTFTGLNWTPGQQFFLRWLDVNDTGSDAGLAIDNLSLTFTTVAIPEPTTAGLGLIGLAGMLVARRRRAC